MVHHVWRRADSSTLAFGFGLMRIGVISDTHGLVRDEAVAALGDSDLILHAGDVGSHDVLAALAAIALLTRRPV